MISIDCSHPDIEEFINIKKDLDKITKANISIKLDSKFMEAVKNKSDYELEFIVNEIGEKITKNINAYDMFKKMAKSNWEMAEPGILYWDRINDWNLLSNDDEFEYAGVNPCAEEPLPAGGSCLLGSINLSEFIISPYTEHAKFDYLKFKSTVKESVIYLNEILDEGLSLHPLQEQQDSVRNYRQIGLGIMGISDMFIKLGVKYGDDESIKISNKIAKTMLNSALQQSALLSKEFGEYPKYNKNKIMQNEFLLNNATKETYNLIEKYGLRNSQLLTIAPTGSISTMIGVSGGIEPIFNISYIRKTQTLHDKETSYKVYTPIVNQYMDLFDINNEDNLPNYFVVSQDIDYKNRIKMQSTWQNCIDASISSTINLAENTTVDEIIDLYIYGYEMGLKGLTVYRDNCSRTGILINEKKDDVEQEAGCST